MTNRRGAKLISDAPTTAPRTNSEARWSGASALVSRARLVALRDGREPMARSTDMIVMGSTVDDYGSAHASRFLIRREMTRSQIAHPNARMTQLANCSVWAISHDRECA